MTRIFIIVFFSVLNGFLVLGQPTYSSPEIVRLLVEPETNMTHIYFRGTDHPDADFYLINQWAVYPTGPAGNPLQNSFTDHDGSEIYFVELPVEEVTQGPVGFNVTVYRGPDDPMTELDDEFVDSTMHLSVQYDSCNATAYLEWNDYNRWRERLLEYLSLIHI